MSGERPLRCVSAGRGVQHGSVQRLLACSQHELLRGPGNGARTPRVCRRLHRLPLRGSTQECLRQLSSVVRRSRGCASGGALHGGERSAAAARSSSHYGLRRLGGGCDGRSDAARSARWHSHAAASTATDRPHTMTAPAVELRQSSSAPVLTRTPAPVAAAPTASKCASLQAVASAATRTRRGA